MMIGLTEAKSVARSILLQSASLSGLDVSEKSMTVLSQLIEEAYPKIDDARRPEAVINLLKVINAALQKAYSGRLSSINEDSIAKGKTDVCPVYPFDKD